MIIKPTSTIAHAEIWDTLLIITATTVGNIVPENMSYDTTGDYNKMKRKHLKNKLITFFGKI